MRQAGWAGILAFLIALGIASVVVAMMLRGSLGGDKAQSPPAAAPSEAVAGSPSPRQAIERARALEQDLQRQAEDLDKRIDSQDK